MKLVYSPQRADLSAVIDIAGEVLTVTVGEVTDRFDFTGMPDGRTEAIESALTHNPVLGAERVDGELTVTLIHWYGPEPRYAAPAHTPPELAVLEPLEGEVEEAFAARRVEHEAQQAEALADYEIEYAAATETAQLAHDAALTAWQLETQVREVIL